MSDKINFVGHVYAYNGSAWVREDGGILGAAYVEHEAVAPAVGRYAVEVARAGDDTKRREQSLFNARRSLGAVAYNVVLTLATDLRSSGAVLAA